MGHGSRKLPLARSFMSSAACPVSLISLMVCDGHPAAAGGRRGLRRPAHNLSNKHLTASERRGTLFSRLAGRSARPDPYPKVIPRPGPSAVPFNQTGSGGCGGPGQGGSPVLGGSRLFLSVAGNVAAPIHHCTDEISKETLSKTVISLQTELSSAHTPVICS
jgi:hypothetical protein